ncbi:MAG TPA: DUF2442 domain-containing protein [Acetobacteraceae bacterium]|nr:DUF2442 domain-containing protein [Acetobacteraceae bacterium]
MNSGDIARAIVRVDARSHAIVRVQWSDGVSVDLDLGMILRDRRFRALSDPKEFKRVHIGDWGHSIEWDSGPELSAEALWLLTLSATGRSDTKEFLEWRLRHGLSLSGAADALGLSRRMVAYYSNGEKRVPRTILLACKGWEVSEAAA